LELMRANLQNVTLRRQDVEQAQSAVKQAAAQLAFNQAQFDKSFIRSPIAGTVLQLNVQQGETLAAGLSAPTLIVVADLHRLEVDAYVDETDIGKVKIGQAAQVVVDAFPDRIFQGKVTKVASGSTIQQGVVTYDVVISLNNAGVDLKPDMTASVTIVTGSVHNALLIPTVAVHNGVKGATVNVLRKDAQGSSIKAVPVKAGGSDGINTQILKGLTEKDIIVVAGSNLSDTRGAPRAASSPFGPSGGRPGGGGGRGGG